MRLEGLFLGVGWSGANVVIVYMLSIDVTALGKGCFQLSLPVLVVHCRAQLFSYAVCSTT